VKSRGETCDFCGALRGGRARPRLVWDSGPGGEFVLADLCERCAGEADRLLEMYGGRGRAAMRLTTARLALAAEPARLQQIRGSIVRGLVYVLIALAAFLVVTFLTSRG
jgi:hypothetical protein